MTHQTEDHQQHVTDIIGPWSVPPVELTLRSSLRRPFHSRRTSTCVAATDVSHSDGEVTRGAENQHLPALNSFFFSSLLNMCNQWKNGSSSGREKKILSSNNADCTGSNRRGVWVWSGQSLQSMDVFFQSRHVHLSQRCTNNLCVRSQEKHPVHRRLTAL